MANNLSDVLRCSPESPSEVTIPVGDEEVSMSLTGCDTTRPPQFVDLWMSSANERTLGTVYIDLGRPLVDGVQLVPQYY